MGYQMHLVWTQAALVVVGDLVFRQDDVYRVYSVEPDPLRRRVRICLEACRWGDLEVQLTDDVQVERMS